jgi:hypothetical protein
VCSHLRLTARHGADFQLVLLVSCILFARCISIRLRNDECVSLFCCTLRLSILHCDCPKINSVNNDDVIVVIYWSQEKCMCAHLLVFLRPATLEWFIFTGWEWYFLF